MDESFNIITLGNRISNIRSLLQSISESLFIDENTLYDSNTTVHPYGAINIFEIQQQARSQFFQLFNQLEIVKKWFEVGQEAQLAKLKALPTHQVTLTNSLKSLYRRILKAEFKALKYLEDTSGWIREPAVKIIDLKNDSVKTQNLVNELTLKDTTIFRHIVIRLKILLDTLLPAAKLYEEGGKKLTITMPSLLIDLEFGEEDKIEEVSFLDDCENLLPQIQLWALEALRNEKFDDFANLLKAAYDFRFSRIEKLEELVSTSYIENDMILFEGQNRFYVLLTNIETDLMRLAIHDIQLGIAPVETLYLRGGWIAPSPAGLVSIFYIHPQFLTDCTPSSKPNPFECDININDSNNSELEACTQIYKAIPYSSFHKYPSLPLCNYIDFKKNTGEKCIFTLEPTALEILDHLIRKTKIDWFKLTLPTFYSNQATEQLYPTMNARITIGIGPIEQLKGLSQSSFIETLSMMSSPIPQRTPNQSPFVDDINIICDSYVAWRSPNPEPTSLNLNFFLELSSPLPISQDLLRLLLSIGQAPWTEAVKLATSPLASTNASNVPSFYSNEKKGSSLADVLLTQYGGLLSLSSRISCNGEEFFLKFAGPQPPFLLIWRIPFVHLGQFQPILWILRQQIVFNNLFKSCCKFSENQKKRNIEQMERDHSTKNDHYNTHNQSSSCISTENFTNGTEEFSNNCSKDFHSIEFSYLNCIGWQVLLRRKSTEKIENFLIKVGVNGSIVITTDPDGLEVKKFEKFTKLLNATHNIPLSLANWLKNEDC